jgi:cytochrome b6-f complex iron-sulfur subunit
MNRRELIQRVIMGTTTLILLPSMLTSCEKEQVPVSDEIAGPKPDTPKSNLVIDLSLADYSALNTAGGSKVVDGIIIANTGTNGFIALSSACTHQGTQLKYNSKANSFECFSHGSVFSSTGSVTNGPASVPLQSYTVSRSGNILTIIR